MATGCDTCEQNLTAEIESKSEEDLTESEKKLLQEGADAAVPTVAGAQAYGPLSSWDGDYCTFCHAVGQFLALALFAVVVYAGMRYSVAFPYTITFGLIVYVPLAVVVGVLGRFPVFGAMFGPIIEKFTALYLNIYLTESARKKYGQHGYIDGSMEERDELRHGPEMHVVPTQAAMEMCAAPDESGALMRVEIEQTMGGPRIVDTYPFDPDVNAFENLQVHVDLNAPTVCHSQNPRQPITELNFTDAIQEQQGAQ